jgi:V8-like Glu-specific endopeptidase
MIDAMRRSTIPARLALVAVLLMVTGCSHPASDVARAVPAPPSAAVATATPVQPDPQVGAVFLGPGAPHSCAAAVLHSTTGDLIMTAAHCLTGGDSVTFVPGFSGDGGPDGTWTVNAVYLDPRWVAKQDPRADFAIARVGHTGADTLEARVGHGLALGSTPRPGSVVTITAYPGGAGGGPIGCSGPTAVTSGGFPSMDCAGFVDGTSGAPWRSGSTLVGVIGGLHGGGCPNENLSYSPPFDDSVQQLLSRAETGGPTDTPPQSFSDDCVRS